MVKPGPIHITLPDDLADIVRGRLATGQFGSAEEVVRAALALMSTQNTGDNAATIRQKIEVGWQQAKARQLLDGEVAKKRWQERQDRHTPGAGA